jgi:uncharacterized damage-inducible protein DinB
MERVDEHGSSCKCLRWLGWLPDQPGECHRAALARTAGLAARIPRWKQDADSNRDIVEESLAIAEQAAELASWLDLSWQVADLGQTYRHTWNGDTYSVSRQWTLWRILSHDIHHGGELSLMLGLQGIQAFELSDLFDHITLPPLAGPTEE